jgi:hypothetical protein
MGAVTTAGMLLVKGAASDDAVSTSGANERVFPSRTVTARETQLPAYTAAPEPVRETERADIVHEQSPPSAASASARDPQSQGQGMPEPAALGERRKSVQHKQLPKRTAAGAPKPEHTTTETHEKLNIDRVF